MKCDNCGKKMKTVLVETTIQYDGISIKVKSIPAFKCPNCDRQLIHDIVIKRAENYISQYGLANNCINFGECERKENEDAVTTMQTLGIL